MAINTCPRCKTSNRDSARFCQQCGQKLAVMPPHAKQVVAPQQQVICETCGGINRAQSRFCGRCGAAMINKVPVPPAQKPKKPAIKRSHALGLGIAGFVALFACLLSVTMLIFWISPLGDQVGTAPRTEETRQAPSESPVDGPRATSASSTPDPSDLDVQSTPTAILIPGLGIEIPRLSDEEEIEIGRQAALEFESDYPLSSDEELIQRVNQIGSMITPNQPRQNISYTFKVVDVPDINAFALPGGFIYVTQGMLDYVENDDELAGVIGHEIAHVALRHSAQQIEAITAGQIVLDVLLSEDPKLETIYRDQSVRIAGELVARIVLSGWGRQAELDADENGTLYMAWSGFDPQGVLNLFDRFMAMQNQQTDDIFDQLLATHPPFSERITRVEYTIEHYELR